MGGGIQLFKGDFNIENKLIAKEGGRDERIEETSYRDREFF